MKRQSLSTQTLYSQLLELLISLDAQRAIGQANGTFTIKKIKTVDYYYFQYSIPGGEKKQVFVGRKNPLLENLVEQYRQEKALTKPDLEQADILCAQLRAGGAMATDAATSRVLKHLAESGLFRQGATLVGTHAFTVLGNMLGVQWSVGEKTEDIDIASHLYIAVSDISTDIPKTLDKIKMGFLPVPSLNPKHPATSFKVRGQSLKVDILTPARSKTSSEPLFIKSLNAAAQPLKFLDYLLEKTQPAAVINGGGILINVPDPARFALHKLIASGERDTVFQTKAEKDRQQSAQLLSILMEDRSGDIRLAIDEIRKRNWIRRLKKAIEHLARIDTTVYEQLKKFI